MELNPNHPTTRRVHHEWHKICFLLMRKFGTDHVEITLAEIERAIAGPEMAVVINDKDNKLILDIVTMKEGERLAREEGGLPA